MEGNFTKAMTPFPKNCLAAVFTYIHGGAFVGQTNYRSLSNGMLSPIEDPLILPAGEYDFYIVSMRSAAFPVSFYQNKATGINNGVDYLWEALPAHNIAYSGTTVPITFLHRSTQVAIYFSAPQVDSVAFMRIQEPVITNSNTWNLITGEIAPASRISSNMLDMKVAGDQASIELVPVSSLSNLNVYLSVRLKGTNAFASYNLSLPLPDNKLQSGYSYIFSVEFKEELLSLNAINIAPWHEIENDNPIYPTSD